MAKKYATQAERDAARKATYKKYNETRKQKKELEQFLPAGYRMTKSGYILNNEGKRVTGKVLIDRLTQPARLKDINQRMREAQRDVYITKLARKRRANLTERDVSKTRADEELYRRARENPEKYMAAAIANVQDRREISKANIQARKTKADFDRIFSERDANLTSGTRKAAETLLEKAMYSGNITRDQYNLLKGEVSKFTMLYGSLEASKFWQLYDDTKDRMDRPISQTPDVQKSDLRHMFEDQLGIDYVGAFYDFL